MSNLVRFFVHPAPKRGRIGTFPGTISFLSGILLRCCMNFRSVSRKSPQILEKTFYPRWVGYFRRLEWLIHTCRTWRVVSGSQHINWVFNYSKFGNSKLVHSSAISFDYRLKFYSFEKSCLVCKRKKCASYNKKTNLIFFVLFHYLSLGRCENRRIRKINSLVVGIQLERRFLLCRFCERFFLSESDKYRMRRETEWQRIRMVLLLL
jgi:hypothetical protein